MHAFYGLDEAGFGPNLGPLVVSVTRWRVPRAASGIDLYEELAEVVSIEADASGTRLHLADSKVVYSPSRGLAALELSAQCLLRLAGIDAATFHSVWIGLVGALPSDLEPWFLTDFAVPLAAKPGEIERFVSGCRTAFDRQGIVLSAIASDIVQTRRFNELTTFHDSKGAALSRITLGLLGRNWTHQQVDKALVILDKHGGRNRYDNLLMSEFPDILPQCLCEGRECSRYRLGPHEFRFQMKAEAHLPVAAASIISKYVRELAMEAFNRFWLAHDPGLRPTKGYPGDASRFRADVQVLKARLEIPDEVFWRMR
ncbi:hypothetical protein [Planctomyces sp. SH-PL14]|uniref:hypothetical protein n=1 Tax=Planctomyces sp. SH-PL14 TaxID=1632864 RepID=UPI00078BD6B8|nr:hypothetical protein [Planctomyces sp. SH-PL14]AMV22236.1 ribonuclease HII [Planctomyces sp. SH-PL14]